MVYYDSADEYVQSCTTLKAKIAAMDAIIEALETQALKAASKSSISQYSLNDGQVIISTTYRNVTEVANSITAFERIRQRYISRLTGRVRRLVDSKNFQGNGRFR